MTTRCNYEPRPIYMRFSDFIVSYFLCAATCDPICHDSALFIYFLNSSAASERAGVVVVVGGGSVQLRALLELNLLQIARQALHNKLRAVDSCATKDTWCV